IPTQHYCVCVGGREILRVNLGSTRRRRRTVTESFQPIHVWTQVAAKDNSRPHARPYSNEPSSLGTGWAHPDRPHGTPTRRFGRDAEQPYRHAFQAATDPIAATRKENRRREPSISAGVSRSPRRRGSTSSSNSPPTRSNVGSEPPPPHESVSNRSENRCPRILRQASKDLRLCF